MEKLRQRIDAQSKILDDMEEDCEEAKAYHDLTAKELLTIRCCDFCLYHTLILLKNRN